MIAPRARSCARTCSIELRTKESVPAMTLFTVTVYVLFHFGLDRDSLDGELASGRAVGDAAARRRDRRVAAVRGRARAGRDRRPAAGAGRPHGAVRRQGRGAVPVPVGARAGGGAGLRAAAARPRPAAAPARSCSSSCCSPTSASARGRRARGRAGRRDARARADRPAAAAAAARPAADRRGPGHASRCCARTQGPRTSGRWLGLLTLYDVVFVLLAVAVFDYLLED